MNLLISALVMGVIATAAIDLWAEILSRVFKLPTTNWRMVGRWFGHFPKGTFIHKPISSSSEIKQELVLGWVIHYIIGIVYALAYLSIVQGSPSVVSAFAFGLVTVLAPWFILQPGLGIGCVARLAPKPNVTRLINLSMHSIFGIGLYIGWMVIGDRVIFLNKI